MNNLETNFYDLVDQICEFFLIVFEFIGGCWEIFEDFVEQLGSIVMCIILFLTLIFTLIMIIFGGIALIQAIF